MSNFSENFAYAAQRAILREAGLSEEDIKKPFVGVITAQSPLMSGHRRIQEIADCVFRGIIDRGGTPILLPVHAVCTGLSEGHHGAKFVLPGREVTADAVEALLSAHALDAAVCVGTCGMTVAGMLLGLIRAGLPALIVGDGGRCEGCASDCGGRCEGMAVAAEVLGLSLPGNASLPAGSVARRELARRTGEAVMTAVKDQLTPRQILTVASLRNAIAVNMALQPSTDVLLHLLAVGKALGFNLDKFFKADLLNQISARTPLLAADISLCELDAAGGAGAVAKSLLDAGILDGSCLTAFGGTLADACAGAELLPTGALHTPADPISRQGGLIVLQGNLAERGALLKRVGNLESFSGPARVFDSVEDAAMAASGGRLSPGDAAVVRFEGPKGGPGMRTVAPFLAALRENDLSGSVAVITDGRCPDDAQGLVLCHVTPEAYGSNPLAVLRDDDVVEIDLKKLRLSAKLTGRELEQRRRRLHVEEKSVSGLLKHYKALAEDAFAGAGSES